MENVKYLILGAGPAGLSFAHRLKEKGEDSFLLLEKENEAGGLCRSVMVDESPFDVGGGHFLDVKRPKVTEFLFRFMEREEWNLFTRDSRIAVGGAVVGHPMEANIWQFGIEEQIAYLSSIARAGCNGGRKMPDKFTDWIVWKLGEKIAEDYMLPYNQKMFGEDLDMLGTYWLEKLPDVSFEETLRSCLMREPYGTQPGHARFYYPKHYGYGEVWLRMARALAPRVCYGADIKEIDFDIRRVRTKSGEHFQGDKIITTIPWMEFEEIKGMPRELVSAVRKLKTSAVETRYRGENLDTPAQWIYLPDPQIPCHRILVRHNFSKGSRGYWTETRLERVEMFPAQDEHYRHVNPYAYPINTVDKPEIMKHLLAFGETRKVYGLGRWGEHCHYNSDVVVERAMDLAEKIGWMDLGE